MSHPSLGKTAVFINIVIIFILTFAILIQTASIKNERKENIPIPKTDKLSLIGDIDTQRIINADKEPHNWLAHGRDYYEQRYSPLDQINTKTIKDLELEWSLDMGTTRGLEATPIVDNGIMFVSVLGV